MLHVAYCKSENLVFKKVSPVLQTIQFECPRVVHYLMSLTFEGNCGVPFSLHAGKWECCMWPIEKVEIHFSKKCLVDCNWSNLKLPTLAVLFLAVSFLLL